MKTNLKKQDRYLNFRTKKAWIVGISGQDGSLLAQLLLSKGYDVIGSSRIPDEKSYANLQLLGIADEINIKKLDISDKKLTEEFLVKNRPDEIYNFSGHSNLAAASADPIGTFHSIALGALHLLQAIKNINPGTRLFLAGSSECFGRAETKIVDESTPFVPKNPYAIARASAFWSAVNFRSSYGIYACSGILFNHESYLRPDTFVTKKIIKSVIEIAKYKKNRLKLGNIHAVRDWGWAPEYVEAIWLMLQQNQATDYILATGRSYSIQDFLDCAFSYLQLNWKDWVDIDETLKRATDANTTSYANPKKIQNELGWSAKSDMRDVIKKMIDYELSK
jgi:GDPmannose 4,6-dehydratase